MCILSYVPRHKKNLGIDEFDETTTPDPKHKYRGNYVAADDIRIKYIICQSKYIYRKSETAIGIRSINPFLAFPPDLKQIVFQCL